MTLWFGGRVKLGSWRWARRRSSSWPFRHVPHLRQGLPLRAVKPISRSQWNGGNGADSGPSRGDRRRRAIRPTATSTNAVGYGRNTSTPAVHGVGAKRQIHPAMASADFVLSLRQQLVRIDADGANDGDVFRRVMARIEQGPHASLDAPWLRSIRSEAPARTLSGGQRMRRPENENNVGQANGADRRHDRHPV
jgi:hypothetical protein